MITVLIVDDQAMVASGLSAVLQTYPGIHPVGTANTIAAAITSAVALQPQLILLDYRLPDGLAPDSIAELRRSCGGAVIVISASGDTEAVSRSLAAGASGFLLKDQPVEELVSAIERVARGERVVASELMFALLDRLAASEATIALTAKQRQILQFLADGLSTPHIAATLQVSPHTVRNHIQTTIVRLGAHSKLEAVAIGVREGLIEPPKVRS